LSEDGQPVPEPDAGDEGVAAGGGAGEGPVRVLRGGDDLANLDHDIVLVTEELGPELASVLPRLAGLVATTGSPLSHVAILARESGVPTVVGFSNALDRFEDDQRVQVDGDSGDVEPIEETT
jgi:pyruvate,water dikinase